MKELLIVDGYNILHAWGELKKTLEKDFDHARMKLIDILGNYQAVKGIKVLLVFDAHLVKGGMGSRENVAGVDVIYTTEGETADMLIEKLVSQLGQKERITVATSDWTEQRLVFGKGAIRLSARELEKEISDSNDEVQGHFSPLQNDDRKLRCQLDDRVRKTLEEIRRQK